MKAFDNPNFLKSDFNNSIKIEDETNQKFTFYSPNKDQPDERKSTIKQLIRKFESITKEESNSINQQNNGIKSLKPSYSSKYENFNSNPRISEEFSLYSNSSFKSIDDGNRKQPIFNNPLNFSHNNSYLSKNNENNRLKLVDLSISDNSNSQNYSKNSIPLFVNTEFKKDNDVETSKFNHDFEQNTFSENFQKIGEGKSSELKNTKESFFEKLNQCKFTSLNSIYENKNLNLETEIKKDNTLITEENENPFKSFDRKEENNNNNYYNNTEDSKKKKNENPGINLNYNYSNKREEKNNSVLKKDLNNSYSDRNYKKKKEDRITFGIDFTNENENLNLIDVLDSNREQEDLFNETNELKNKVVSVLNKYNNYIVKEKKNIPQKIIEKDYEDISRDYSILIEKTNNESKIENRKESCNKTSNNFNKVDYFYIIIKFTLEEKFKFCFLFIY